MKTKATRLIIVTMGFIVAILCRFIAIAATDAPHNASNNINCGSCHGETIMESPFWGTGTYDQLCLSCHRRSTGGPYSQTDAPAVTTHSDSSGSALAECRDCHNPHYQRQKVYKNTDASNLYLATGKILLCEYSGKDPLTNKDISTFHYSDNPPITYKSATGWGATKLPEKTEDYRGAILFPNVNKLGYNYPITAVNPTAKTITVNGNLTTECNLFSSATFAAMYGQYIKDVLNTKTVKFFDQTGANSFADGDTTYNGVCEVCHTQTEHFRNNGSAPDQNHSNLCSSEKGGTNCITCHNHTNGFGHGYKNDCADCHGHDNGWNGGTYHGTTQSHSTHTENDSDDLKGPNITCGDCHDVNKFPYFKTGTDNNGDGKYSLSETDVCNTCHSPNGSYNGISNAAIGAKNNWCQGVYQGNELKSGKEKWCAGCHDENPSNSKADSSGINAPNVIGGETGSTPYGTGYGFYKTGHGLPKYESYPASGANGAGTICTDCHDVAKAHFDHEHRTYSSALNNYQAGYRLATVYNIEGKCTTGCPPMVIPKVCSDPQGKWTDYALCFKCHNRKKVLGGPQYSGEYHQKNYSTNLRNDFLNAQRTSTNVTSTTLTDSGYVGDWPANQQLLMPDSSRPDLIYRIISEDKVTHIVTVDGDMLADNPLLAPGSSYQLRTTTQGHIAHLAGRGGCGGALDWDSDWNLSGDSSQSCPACHNVHGSPSARMVQHGELISTYGTQDKVPSIDFYYLPYLPNNTTLEESTGGRTGFMAGPGDPWKNGICYMCHQEYTSYTRTPSDLYPPKISFVYGEVGSNVVMVSFSEGVYSDLGASGSLVAGDFFLTDTDNGRTILNVAHTAGDPVAVLTLSAPLDSVNDIGTDTLAAASTASIYDASVNPMDTTPAVISGDSDPPSISSLEPANGEVDVALNRNLTFILSDSGIGIDWTTFSIQLSGNMGYAKTYTDTDTAVVSKTGVPSSYRVAVDPDVFFGIGEVITVTVNVDDMAGNSLTPPEWSFTTAVAGIWETPDSVNDSLQLGGSGNLIDDNLVTGNDFSPGGPEHYASFKLEGGGDLYDVTDVRLYGGPSYTRTWRIYVSKDGLTYTQIGSKSVGGASQWYEYAFPSSQTTRYIMINDWWGGPEPANTAFEFQFKGTAVVNTNNAPLLSWTDEPNYTNDGVNPDSAAGGTNFEFRVKYTDADNNAPTVMQVWVDSNDSGTYESTEKYAMTGVDPGDTDYTDGKLYTKTISFLYRGDGSLNYRFVASDGTDTATGSPTADSQVVVINNTPALAWTGETNYTTGGVFPDSATSGNNFEFRISYSDIDNSVPVSIQVWVDVNDNGTYEAGEKYAMTATDSGDTDYTDGKLYNKVMALSYAGDGNLNYRFYASDGTDDAVGAPASDSVVTVAPGTNISPTLAWTGEPNYTIDGVNPNGAAGGSNFEFRVSYADADNNAPAVIQVWVDEDDGDSYEPGEKYDMSEVDPGDTVYTDGKLYYRTLTIAHAGDSMLKYHFWASDGTDIATGAPVSDSIVVATSEEVPAGAVGFWKFDEGSGTVALDETINHNDGTINGAAWTDGKSGNALSFDGTDDYISIPINIDQGGSKAYTFEAWVYPTSNSSGRHHIISTDNGGYDWSLLREGGTWFVFTGSSSWNTGKSVTLDQWQHIVAVFQPGVGVKFYKNGGTPASTTTISYDSSDNSVNIGKNPGYPEYFTGKIDEAVIYDHALTDAEVQTRYYFYGP